MGLRQVSTNVLTDAQHTTTFPKDAHSRNSQASAAPLQFVVTAKQTSTSPRAVYTRTNCTNKARSGMMDVPTSVSVLMAPQDSTSAMINVSNGTCLPSAVSMLQPQENAARLPTAHPMWTSNIHLDTQRNKSEGDHPMFPLKKKLGPWSESDIIIRPIYNWCSSRNLWLSIYRKHKKT